MWSQIFVFAVAIAAAVDAAGAGAGRLICHAESVSGSFSECTHLVYAGNERGDKLDAILKEFRSNNPRVKIVLRVTENDKDLRSLFKSKHVQGFEIYDAHRSLNKTRVQETVDVAKAAMTPSSPLFLTLPAHPELLAKYYDLRGLVKVADFVILQTDALGALKKTTYHPSRLSGMWDMMNTDSVVDLVVGLGVPASKVIISLPASAQQFTLVNETLSTPGSPAVEDQPKEIDQSELCRQLQKGRWTLERDQDLSAPYAFKNKTWISFEDSSSVDVKGKYARVRGLAGLALMKAERDVETPCGPTLKAALTKVLNQQSRAPRALVLRSLEQEILSAPSHARALDALQVSPYRITQVVDSDGVIHSIREDTRTEFSCSRQGYFVHPRSCARFYRCVKFDQLSPDYTVFEFDCPAGLAFDARYEVCVWPGSLPHSQACPGSSEIAPVPKTRFICPDHEGYYADPENCRWFFACLDHGKAPLTAYEFRCPFGLGFDAARLKCDWPWLVPACGNIARYEAEAHGFSGAVLTGAAGFHGHTADSINIAGHQSIVSGAALDNLVGIQGGYLSQADALDNNYIAAQELAYGANSVGANEYQLVNGASANIGFVQPTNYDGQPKYTSGSLLLDDYRQPAVKAKGFLKQAQHVQGYNGANSYSSNIGTQQAIKYQAVNNGAEDHSGSYVHDPTGDYAEHYRHEDEAAVPYVHDGSVYNDYQGQSQYKSSSQYNYKGLYNNGNEGQYVQDNSGDYIATGQANGAYNAQNVAYGSGSYSADYSGSYNGESSGKYVAGIYNSQKEQSSLYGDANGKSSIGIQQYHGGYGEGYKGDYLTDSKTYTGASHTLAAGSVNVGLVGKTTLVDGGYIDQYPNQNAAINNYNAAKSQSYSTSFGIAHNGQLGLVSQPAVSINHLGTDAHNHDGYEYVTTPTTSGVPTTATPFAVTTAIPTITTFKTTFVPEPPKTTIKDIFGLSQQPLTLVKPTFVPVQQQYVGNSNEFGVSSGYDYPKPNIQFEEGINTYSTPAPVLQVAKFKPQGFSHQTLHKTESVYGYSTPAPTLAIEEPFKKVIAYTTGPPTVTYAQPTAPTYTPSSFSQQTFHNVEAANVDTGYEYNVPSVGLEEHKTVTEYTTAKPAVVLQPAVSTYEPQGFSHQTLHKVDTSKVNVYSQQGSVSGYDYPKPSLQFEERPKAVEVSTIQPIIASEQPAVSYNPQTYSQQTIHKIEHQNYVPVTSTVLPKVEIRYQQPTVSVYENPILKYAQKVTPVTYVKPTAAVYTQTYQPVSLQHEIKHISQPVQYESNQHNYNNVQINQGYVYNQPEIQRDYDSRNTYSLASKVSHQVFHQSNENAYKDAKDKVVFVSTTPANLAYEEHYAEYEAPKKIETYSAPEYIPPKNEYQQTYTVSTVASAVQQHISTVEHSNGNVQTYQAPEYIPPKNEYQQTYTVSTVAPAVQQHISTVEHNNDNHQTYQASEYIPPKKEYQQTYTVSTVAPAIQQHISIEHSNVQSYQAPEYIPPKSQESYSVSTPSTPIDYQQFSTVHTQGYKEQEVKQYDAPEYLPPQNEYRPEIYTVSSTPKPEVQQYTNQFSTIHEQNNLEYEKVYKAAEYIPPKNDYQQTYRTVQTPLVEQTDFSSVQHSGNNQYQFKQQDYAQQYEIAQKQIPPQQVSFTTSHIAQPKKIESYHISSFPGTSVTYKPISYQIPEIQDGYQAEEYLPPVVSTPKPVITTSYKPVYTVSTTREYLPPTQEPKYEAPEYLPPQQDNTYLPPSTTAKPIYKSTTPVYKKVKSTTFKAPEYLPPIDDDIQTVNFESYGLKDKIQYNPYNNFESTPVTSTYAPVTRKQNIVVQHAKSHLLGFGTVGPDAGLVSTASYSTVAPIVSVTEIQNLTPKSVTSTYTPVTQGLVEVTPSPVPRRRTKPKVAVVTKINDFNPLLVRKLGAVCSCQSPVVVLKGRRPNVQIQQDYDVDYNNDYDDSGRGDVSDEQLLQKIKVPARIKSVTVSPVRTTFNPIIVPDDDFYQDLPDQDNEFKIVVTPKNKEVYSESYISTTPAYSSTTENVIKIRPRAKSVTVAPTYKTVLLKESSPTPSVVIENEGNAHASVESQTFDRYGPGGWRSRDETLQGSVDCQRAGLFRHPKQCNKFYACRWDSTKHRFTLHVFNCPVQLSFDPTLGACNWPSQGPACQGDTLLTNTF